MERGGFQRRHPRSSSDAIVVSDPNNFGADNSSNNTANDGGFAIREPRPPCPAREQDQYMPIANVIRIMRRILPSHAKISDDAKETMQECVSEYISFITGEANERCQREQRKTITAEDLLWAMGKLGFDNYIQPLTVFLNRYREVESERTSRGEAYKRHVDFVLAPPQPQPFGVPPYVPAFQMGYNPAGMFDAAAAMGGYYRDGGSGAGGSSSQAPMANFDPYAEYK